MDRLNSQQGQLACLVSNLVADTVEPCLTIVGDPAPTDTQGARLLMLQAQIPRLKVITMHIS
jgi:hypothetical protein